jgi:choline dehydrogenase-like flavoprotein
MVFGSRFDYDGWAAAGNPPWSAAELAPLFAAAWQQLRVRPVGLDELTSFQRACRDAIVAAGIPAVADFNDLSQDTGVAPVPVSVDSGTLLPPEPKRSATSGRTPDGSGRGSANWARRGSTIDQRRKP